jgi:hypothetical protein
MEFLTSTQVYGKLGGLDEPPRVLSQTTVSGIHIQLTELE